MDLLTITINGRTIEAPSSLNQGGVTAQQIISNALTLVITIAIIVTVLIIIWAGINWVTSGGDKQKVASARGRLTWAIIGLVIILVSFFIINLFSYLFGIELLNFKIN